MKTLILFSILSLGPVITDDCDGCPPIIDTSATAVPPSDTDSTDDSGTSPTESISGSETSANPPETGGFTGPTTGEPDACLTTEDWCMTFLQWCPFIFNQEACEELAMEHACDGSGTIFEFCAPGIAACEAEPPDPNNPNKCEIAGAKCQAAEFLLGCEGQPAVFTCAYGESGANFCSALGWKWTPGNFCREKCDTQADCGPESYAECKPDGFCSPKVLILC